MGADGVLVHRGLLLVVAGCRVCVVADVLDGERVALVVGSKHLSATGKAIEEIQLLVFFVARLLTALSLSAKASATAGGTRFGLEVPLGASAPNKEAIYHCYLTVSHTGQTEFDIERVAFRALSQRSNTDSASQTRDAMH